MHLDGSDVSHFQDRLSLGSAFPTRIAEVQDKGIIISYQTYDMNKNKSYVVHGVEKSQTQLSD